MSLYTQHATLAILEISLLELASYLCQRARLPFPPKLQTLGAAERLAIAARSIYLHQLFQMGGALLQSIPQDGHPQSQRLWDIPPANLALGPHTSAFLQSLEQTLRTGQIDSIPPPSQGGDVLFYHTIAQLFLDHPHPTLSQHLSRVSPLTRLCRCPVIPEHPPLRLLDQESGHPALTHEEAEALQQHPALHFFCAYLADQWSFFPTPMPLAPPEEQIIQLRARLATFLLWMETAPRTGRFSHLSTFPLWWKRLISEHFVEKVLEIQHFRTYRLSQREALLFCYAEFLRLGERFGAIIEQHITRPGPYGWEDPAEIRVFLSVAGRQWTSGGIQQQVQEAQHQLRRIL